MSNPNTDDFRAELRRVLADASMRRLEYIDVNAGQLHRTVGGYPTPYNRMPICCGVMREAMRAGDVVVSEPPKGKGASLTIRYRLPR